MTDADSFAARVGPVFSVADLARWLDPERSPSEIRSLVQRRELVAFGTDDGELAFPAWQFDIHDQRLRSHGSVVGLWQQLPHDGFLTAADLAVWMTGKLLSLGASPVGFVLYNGGTATELDDAVSRLRRRAL